MKYSPCRDRKALFITNEYQGDASKGVFVHLSFRRAGVLSLDVSVFALFRISEGFQKSVFCQKEEGVPRTRRHSLRHHAAAAVTVRVTVQNVTQAVITSRDKTSSKRHSVTVKMTFKKASSNDRTRDG